MQDSMRTMTGQEGQEERFHVDVSFIFARKIIRVSLFIDTHPRLLPPHPMHGFSSNVLVCGQGGLMREKQAQLCRYMRGAGATHCVVNPTWL